MAARRLLSIALLSAALTVGGAASAAKVYDTPSPLNGNQTWGGTLGLDFTVNTSVSVDSLGAFDSGGDGIVGNVYTTIFNNLGVAVTPVLDFAGLASTGGAYISQSITPVVLTPGSYQLASWGYSASDPNYNNNGPGGPITFNTIGGALTAVGAEYNYPVNAGTPGSIADVGRTRYGAGTFDATNYSPPPPPPPPPLPGPPGPGIYDAAAGLSGNQAWGGTLGLNFKVVSPIKVSALGTFDSSGGAITKDIYGVIFDSSGHAVTPVLDFFNTTDPTGAAYVFKALPSAVVLPAGMYQVATWGYDAEYMDFNNGGPGGPVTFDTFGGRLQALSSAYGGGAGAFATIADVGTTRYGAGSFLAAPAPEPATWSLMLFGFGAMGAFARRRRASLA